MGYGLWVMDFFKKLYEIFVFMSTTKGRKSKRSKFLKYRIIWLDKQLLERKYDRKISASEPERAQPEQHYFYFWATKNRPFEFLWKLWLFLFIFGHIFRPFLFFDPLCLWPSVSSPKKLPLEDYPLSAFWVFLKF